MNARLISLACLMTLAFLASAHAEAQPLPSRAERIAMLPDWSGIWIIDGPGGMIDVDGYPNGIATVDAARNLIGWTLLGFQAPYRPEVRERFDRELPAILEQSSKLNAEGWGYPMMMQCATPLQFLITPEETLILNFYREARHIHTDGRPLPPEVDRWPSPWGESIGRWEGDTLVIETVSVQQPGIFNIHLPLLTEGARYTERVRMTSPDRIESEMTIHDPAALSEDWVIKLAYRRAEGLDRMFHMPFDNDRTVLEGDSSGEPAPG